MSLLRQMKIQDGTLSTITAGVNTSNELKVNDADANTKLTDIETALGGVGDANVTNGKVWVTDKVLLAILRELRLIRQHQEYTTGIEFTEENKE